MKKQFQPEGGDISSNPSPYQGNYGPGTTNEQHEQRYIVDRDITDNAIEGIFITIQDAIDAAYNSYQAHLKNQPNAQLQKIKIKIASNLYEEQLYINVPGLVLEPKEKGGEVTLQRDHQACIIIDVGQGNSVTINNTRMLLKGSDAPSKKNGNKFPTANKEDGDVSTKKGLVKTTNSSQDIDLRDSYSQISGMQPG